MDRYIKNTSVYTKYVFTHYYCENPHIPGRAGNPSGFECEMGADRRFFHQNPDKAGKLVSLAKKQRKKDILHLSLSLSL